MSQANVERVREAFEYFRRTGEPDLAALHEDVEVHDHDLRLDAPGYRGLDGYVQWIENWANVFTEFSLEDVELVDVGDTVIAFFRMVATGSASGLSIQREDAMVVQMREEKVSRIDYYNNREDALRAAGLKD